MGVQASALGNHEFDVGPGELADAIKADGTYTAQFPYLAINIDFSKDEDFQIGRNGSMSWLARLLAMLWQKSAANLSVLLEL